MSTHTFRVDGMTCGHCVAAVTREVAAVPGVTDVRVDLDGGSVSLVAPTARSDRDVADDVEAAVIMAGYAFAGRR